MVEYNINFLFQLINFFIIWAVIVGIPIYILVKVIKTLSAIQKSNQRIENILEEVNEKLKAKE